MTSERKFPWILHWFGALASHNAMTIQRKLRRNSFESRSFCLHCFVFFLSFSTLNTVHIHYVKSQCQTVCRCSFCVRIVGMCMCFCSPCFTALFCATKTINLSVDNFWRLNLILMMSTNEKMFNNYRKQLTWTLMRHEKEMPKSENATTS